MAATQQQTNIWAQMSYIPPKGPCSQKNSVFSGCTCYRFMIHPLKAASSFDCDGCGHHACFHRMDNREEEEIARRWAAEDEAAEQSAGRRLEFGHEDRSDERGREIGMEGERAFGEMKQIGAPPGRGRIMDVTDEVVEVGDMEDVVARPAVKGKKRKGNK